MQNEQSNIVKFTDYKTQITEALMEKVETGKLRLDEKVTIIDGFVNQPLSMELSNSFTIGGPAIPLIMLIGNDSGRIYYFALKAILPNIKI